MFDVIDDKNTPAPALPATVGIDVTQYLDKPIVIDQKYRQDAVDYVLKELIAGKELETICRKTDVPPIREVNSWIIYNSAFGELVFEILQKQLALRCLQLPQFVESSGDEPEDLKKTKLYSETLLKLAKTLTHKPVKKFTMEHTHTVKSDSESAPSKFSRRLEEIQNTDKHYEQKAVAVAEPEFDEVAVTEPEFNEVAVTEPEFNEVAGVEYMEKQLTRNEDE